MIIMQTVLNRLTTSSSWDVTGSATSAKHPKLYSFDQTDRRSGLPILSPHDHDYCTSCVAGGRRNTKRVAHIHDDHVYAQVTTSESTCTKTLGTVGGHYSEPNIINAVDERTERDILSLSECLSIQAVSNTDGLERQTLVDVVEPASLETGNPRDNVNKSSRDTCINSSPNKYINPNTTREETFNIHPETITDTENNIANTNQHDLIPNDKEQLEEALNIITETADNFSREEVNNVNANVKANQNDRKMNDTEQWIDRDLHVDLPNFDTDIEMAALDSLMSASLMPLVKQELQFKIQYERLSRGEPELLLEPAIPKQYPLRPDEIAKKQVRREQNRRSAVKCRAREEYKEGTLMKMVNVAHQQHRRLNKMIRRLRIERNSIRSTLESHMQICANSDSTLTVKTTDALWRQPYNSLHNSQSESLHVLGNLCHK